MPTEKEFKYVTVSIYEVHPVSKANSPIFSTQIGLSQFYLYILHNIHFTVSNPTLVWLHHAS